MPPLPTRPPLHQRSDSETNILAKVRLVPHTPPRIPGDHDTLYSRTPLPTLPSHFLPPTTGATYKGSTFALEQPGSVVSAEARLGKSPLAPGCTVTTTLQDYQSDQSRPSTAASTKSRPLTKKRKHVALNPDNKTFRVLDVDQEEVQTEERSKLPDSTITASQDVSSSDAHGTSSSVKSTASCVPESTKAPIPSSPTPTAQASQPGDHVTQSPWNYQFVGGLRKVPKTPDLKLKATLETGISAPPLPQTSADPKTTPALTTKPSFQSTVTISTISESSNYKIYEASPTQAHPRLRQPLDEFDDYAVEHRLSVSRGAESLDAAPPSSSDSNYHILEYSSQFSSDSGVASDSYQLDLGVSPSLSYAAISSPTGLGYSRESLVVPPLRPRTGRSTERFGYYKSRSRESLRTGSLTSISTVLSHEASQALVASASVIQLPYANSQTASSSWASSAGLAPTRSLMQVHPHQWSSQLSTVPSESDAGTERGSRSFSDGQGRRSSGLPSSYSLQISSVGAPSRREDNHSRTQSLEVPQPIHPRPSPLLVERLDEDGDGITDMPELGFRPSRTRLSDFYSVSSDPGRTSTMRSTTSSRANSLLSSSIPAWARLYYGSGERRYLGAPGSSTEGSDSRPQSSLRSGSPDMSNFPLSIYSPRRRPRQINPRMGHPSSNRGGSMEISSLPDLDDGALIYHNSFRRRFRPSSSILSPHLKRDKRAKLGSKFFSEPASINWSTDGDIFSSHRKRLIVLFIAGFIFPFAWMIGAVLPLPAFSTLSTGEMDQNLSDLEVSKAMDLKFGPTDEVRYEGAKWWRNLNRGMTIVGFLVIAAIVTLAILGTKQRWMKQP